MRELRNGIRAKIRSAKGETITEVLVAIVIGGLAVLLLGTTISASLNVNQKSRQAMDEYYGASNSLAEIEQSGAATAKGTGTVTLKTKTGEGAEGAVVNLSESGSVSVVYVVGEQVSDTPVFTYKEEAQP